MEQHVAKGKVGDAREYLLLDLIKTSFELEPGEEDNFNKLLSRPEYREAYEVELTSADVSRATSAAVYVGRCTRNRGRDSRARLWCRDTSGQ
jgi:hypothetical protein